MLEDQAVLHYLTVVICPFFVGQRGIFFTRLCAVNDPGVGSLERFAAKALAILCIAVGE